MIWDDLAEHYMGDNVLLYNWIKLNKADIVMQPLY